MCCHQGEEEVVPGVWKAKDDQFGNHTSQGMHWSGLETSPPSCSDVDAGLWEGGRGPVPAAGALISRLMALSSVECLLLRQAFERFIFSPRDILPSLSPGYIPPSPVYNIKPLVRIIFFFSQYILPSLSPREIFFSPSVYYQASHWDFFPPVYTIEQLG